MALTQVIKKTFTDPNTGQPIEYERLAIIGVLSGETHTLELKLGSSDLKLAKILLSSNEEIPEQIVRAANDAELDAFLSQNAGRSSDDKIDLNEE